MAEHMLHYAGDTFALDDEESAHVAEAISLVAHDGAVIVVDLEGHATAGGPSVTHRFLFGPGIPVYLTTTASLTD
jgi:hypothetical protein